MHLKVDNKCRRRVPGEAADAEGDGRRGGGGAAVRALQPAGGRVGALAGHRAAAQAAAEHLRAAQHNTQR